MKTIKQLRESIAELKAEAEAICALADEEKRELTADEQTRFDAIAGTEETPGEIAGLQTELARAERREELKRQSLQNRIETGQVETPAGGDGFDDSPFANINVPARARHARNLHFAGPNADREAYACGQWFAAIVGNTVSRDWCDNNGINWRNTMVEGTESLGGFAVPDPMEAAIIDLTERFGIFRQYATRKPMSSDTLTTPRNIGDLTCSHPDETVAITKSDARGDKVVLTAKKYACLTELSTELNEDSIIDMVNLVVMKFGKAIAKKEDTNGFLGDGTATYASVNGLLTAALAVTGTPSVLTASAIALGSLTLADFEQCEAALPDFEGADPAWYCNKSVFGNAMAPLMRAAGGNTVRDIGGRVAQQFLGYDARFSQVLPRVPAANEIIAIYGDLSLSTSMGVRRGMTIATSTEGDYFVNDTVGVKATTRTAINNHDVGTAAASASGDQPAVEELAGPVIILRAPAS